MDQAKFIHYKVDVPTIDEDHLRIFTILENMKWKYTDEEMIRLLVSELESLLEFHFADEEKYMEQMGFPYIAAHRNAHAELLYFIQGLMKRMDIKQGYSIKYIADTVSKQFSHHIDWHDMQYAEFAKKQSKEGS